MTGRIHLSHRLSENPDRKHGYVFTIAAEDGREYPVRHRSDIQFADLMHARRGSPVEFDVDGDHEHFCRVCHKTQPHPAAVNVRLAVTP